jgi:hypothetical protein
LKRITPGNTKYKNFVEDYDERHYDIYSKYLDKGQEIVCPHDPDMLIKKTENGEVVAIKRSFLKSVFARQRTKFSTKK